VAAKTDAGSNSSVTGKQPTLQLVFSTTESPQQLRDYYTATYRAYRFIVQPGPGTATTLSGLIGYDSVQVTINRGAAGDHRAAFCQRDLRQRLRDRGRLRHTVIVALPALAPQVAEGHASGSVRREPPCTGKCTTRSWRRSRRRRAAALGDRHIGLTRRKGA